MDKARIAIDVFADSADNCIVDKRSLYVFDSQISLDHMVEMINEINNSYKPNIAKDIPIGQVAKVYMDVWMDSGDDDSDEWYDYEVTETMFY